MATQLELITSKTCPFAQRVAIALHEREINFTTTYIDLQNKPDWFLAISPLGKIPVLRVNDLPLFESAVINEYLDEVYQPRLHPDDSLQRAINRAWIEVSSDMIMACVHLVRASDQQQFSVQQQIWEQKIARLETELKNKPFFNGARFSLVDAAWAPLFVRVVELQKISSYQFLAKCPKMQQWAEQLLQKKSVQMSLAPDFKEALLLSVQRMGPYFAKNYLI